MNLLIAEDDLAIQRAYRRMLRNHTLTLVESAPAAISVLSDRAPNYFGAIVSDYNLAAGTTGRQIWVWARANRPDLPFILVTGRVDTDLPVPTLQKPLDLERLEKMLP